MSRRGGEDGNKAKLALYYIMTHDGYQSSLLDDLKAYKHRLVFPIVEATKDSSKFEGVRKKCSQLLEDLRDSVFLIWDETKTDNHSTAVQRAARMTSALNDRIDAETTVHEIFSAYKGYRLTDSNDAGLLPLRQALNEKNERVQLAAARVLVKSDLPLAHGDRGRAVAALVHLALRGEKAVLRREAFQLLSDVPIGKPVLISLDSRCAFKVWREANGLTATQYIDGKPNGFLYAGGGSLAFERHSNGALKSIWEDGVRWLRTERDGKPTDEWRNLSTGSIWKGDIEVRPDHSYQYTKENSTVTRIRDRSGRWRTVSGTKAIR